MPQLVMRGLTKVFRGGTVAIDHVDLSVDDGEFVVLVGPSGCGKSTLLRMVAGLEDITSGTVEIDGQVVNHLSPRERDVAMVFQNYALYPHYTVAENLGFSLKIRHYPKPDARDRVNDTARVLGLDQLLHRKPAALSGGQRQRVAMGRSLVRQPSLLLMDEPLSNLDAKLRVAMRGELIRLHQRYKTTTLYVTHDQVEAMTLGDRIAVLDRGRLQQVGTPGGAVPDAVQRVRCRLHRVSRDEPGPRYARRRGRHPRAARQRVRGAVAGRLGAAVAEPGRPGRPGGHLRTAAGRVPGGLWRRLVRRRRGDGRVAGDEKNVLFVPPFDQRGVDAGRGDDEIAPLWTARFDPDVTVRPGDQLVLRPDLSELYFFDPVTTAALPATIWWPHPVAAFDG
jgi:multiple sugar transport system ATP-binding protein